MEWQEMGNYSKLIGSFVGGGLGFGVAIGILPEAAASPELVSAITTIFAGIATYAFPANTG